MNYVTDTMALVLLLEGRHMPSNVQKIFFSALAKKTEIYIPMIAVIEVAYLSEKKRISATVKDIRNLPEFSFKIVDLDLKTATSAFEILDIPELHDRLVAGCARALDCPVITNDPVIAKSKFVTSIWK